MYTKYIKCGSWFRRVWMKLSEPKTGHTLGSGRRKARDEAAAPRRPGKDSI